MTQYFAGGRRLRHHVGEVLPQRPRVARERSRRRREGSVAHATREQIGPGRGRLVQVRCKARLKAPKQGLY